MNRAWKLMKHYTLSAENGQGIEMEQWQVIGTPWFSLRLHKIMTGDLRPGWFHNHRWAFLGLVLKGGYLEETPRGFQVRPARRLFFSPLSAVHRITEPLDGPSWSLILTGPVRRDWSFINDRTGEVVNWRVLLS